MFNDLFWALYLIDVLTSVVPTFVIIGVGVLLVALFWTILLGNVPPTKGLTWLVALGFAAAVVILVIPSKQTMYMMLGVRATENFTQTEMGKKLEAYINGQVDEFLKGTSK